MTHPNFHQCPCRNSQPTSPRTPLPAFEQLEGRLLLSTTYVVDSLADIAFDDGLLTLREALTAANTDKAVNDAPAGDGADIIQFADALFTAGPASIELRGLGLVVSDDLAITGPGADLLTITRPQRGVLYSGDYDNRMLAVESDTTVVLSDVTLSGAGWWHLDDGGGVHNEGTMTITDAIISDNYTSEGDGGGIYNKGTMTISGTTISANRADRGGGIFNDSSGTLTITDSTISSNASADGGGGIWNKETLTLSNCTIWDNRTDGEGGALASTDGTVTITNCTIAGNIASESAGGVDVAGTTMTVHNTIIAANHYAGSGPEYSHDVQGTFETASSYNLIGVIDGSTDLAGGTGTVSGSAVVPLDAMLNAPADNGGDTLTMEPKLASPAIDAGSNDRATDAGLTTDQRGSARVIDGDGDDTAVVDMGAYERRTLYDLDIGELGDKTTYPGTVGGGVDDVIYRFTLSGISEFALKLKGIKAEAGLQLIDANGDVVQATTVGDKTQTIAAELEAGTYYVRVFSSDDVATNYALQLSAKLPARLRKAARREQRLLLKAAKAARRAEEKALKLALKLAADDPPAEKVI